MPISNPIVQIEEVTQQVTVINQGAAVIIDTASPQTRPIEAKSFWLNSVEGRLFVAINTTSVNDWIEISSPAMDWADISNKPTLFPANVDWADISNKPTLFPANVDWADISNKPTLFPANVDWADISSKPTLFPANAADILKKIVIENNAVLTDGKNVIFENQP